MSRQGTIRRYALIIEKVSREDFPSKKQILDYLDFHGFEISDRTLSRDIAAIRLEFHTEITYHSGKDGYFIDYDNSIDIDGFMRFLEIVNTAELLVESLKQSKDSLENISFDQGGGLRGVELLKPLLGAIRDHRKITFKHLNYQTGKTNTFTLSPYLLKEYQNRWYVIGLVAGMKDLRTFGVDRITELEVKTDTFVPSPKYNPKETFKDTIGLFYSMRKKERVVLSFTPSQGNYIKSLKLHSSQTELVNDDTEYRIELNIIPNLEFIQIILMHSDQVRVIEPQWLIDEIKSLLKNTLKKY